LSPLAAEVTRRFDLGQRSELTGIAAKQLDLHAACRRHRIVTGRYAVEPAAANEDLGGDQRIEIHSRRGLHVRRLRPSQPCPSRAWAWSGDSPPTRRAQRLERGNLDG